MMNDPQVTTGYRKALRSPTGVGLVISGILHAVVIVLYAFLGTPIPSEFAMAAPAEAGAEVAGTQLVQIAEVPGEEVEALAPEIEEDPEEEVPVEAVEVDRGVVPGVPDAEPSPDRVVTAGEVLAPDAADSVMLRGVDPEIARMTQQEELDARIRWAIEEFGDAEEASRRAAEEALDWTRTDSEGNRWGVSPGKLHLGSVTMPLPLGFGRTRGADAAADEQDDRLGELEAQAARGRVWENWQRRAAVIRERRDLERAERAAARDTTRSR